MNEWEGQLVTLSLEEDGRFTAIDKATGAVILSTLTNQFERVYDYGTAIVITVGSVQYKFNFAKLAKVKYSLLFGGLYNWVISQQNNPLSGLKQKWLAVFKQNNVKIYKDRAGRSVLIAIGVFILIVAGFILYLALRSS